MATKVRSKGTALLMSIASVYTAVPNCKNIALAGEKSLSYDSTVLGGGTFKTKNATGFADPCTITADIFRDPADTVHAALKALIATPVDTNFKVTYADTAPTSEIYSIVTVGLDTTADIDNGLSGTLTLETSGAPA